MSMKNHVGVASLVLGLLALTAACSSSSGDDGGADADTEDAVVRRPDAGRGDSALQSCATPAPPTRSYPPARIQKGACDQGTIAATVTAQSFGQIDDIVALASDACQACYKATEESAAAWGPFVLRQSGTGETAVLTGDPINWVGCARAAGFSDACASGFQSFQDCFAVACGTCQTQAESDECFNEVIDQGGACSGPVQAFTGACGSLDPVITRCGTFPRVFAALCGPNAGVPADGGVPQDAGDGG